MATNSLVRRFTAARSRAVTAVVSLIWLNLAMLPCAMAVEQEHNCPGCPPDQEQQMASHHEHGQAEKSADCEATQSDCCDLDEFSLDDRSQKSGKDVGEQLSLAIGLDIAESVRQVGSIVFTTGPPHPPSGAQRLHAIYCVYLD